MKKLSTSITSSMATMAIAIAIAIVMAIATASVSDAGQRKLIRFYKVNEKGQESHQRMIGNTDEAGCHNVRRSLKASRVVVLGFSWCAVHAEKDCTAQSRLVPNWDGDRKKSETKSQSSGRMDQGTRWILDPIENISVASFNCVSE